MKKICKYCGKVVDENHRCSMKPNYKKNEPIEVRKFRNSERWRKKSLEIRDRDHYLCRVCLATGDNPISTLNSKNLEVHHIIPLQSDWEKRLDNDNLITLCQYHHKKAERGDIDRDELTRILKENTI